MGSWVGFGFDAARVAGCTAFLVRYEGGSVYDVAPPTVQIRRKRVICLSNELDVPVTENHPVGV